MRRRGQRLHHQHDLDLYQRGVHWRAWLGIVLHQRLYSWSDTVSVGCEPSDVRRRRQRLHRLCHVALRKRTSVRRVHVHRPYGPHRRVFCGSVGRVADAQWADRRHCGRAES